MYFYQTYLRSLAMVCCLSGGNASALHAETMPCPEETAPVSEEQRFLSAVTQADTVFIGQVVRMYQPPGMAQQEKYQGVVFEVTENLKGEMPRYIDTLREPSCGISNAVNSAYWPNEVEQSFVAAVINDNGEPMLIAVMPEEQAQPLMAKIWYHARF